MCYSVDDHSLPNSIWLSGQCNVESEADQSQPGLVLGWMGLWTKPINVIVRMKNFKQRENH